MKNGKDARKTVGARRKSMMWSAVLTTPLVAFAWLGLYFLTPLVPGADVPLNRLAFALGWICVASLLTLFAGIEAVAHERFFTPAIDPLAGEESVRMKINLRYLQNTLEQMVAFVPGLLLLAWYAADGRQLRAVTATAVVWIALRFLFWAGYHRSAEMRTPGAVAGLVMTMMILCYGAARFGYDLAGWPGAIAPLALFGLIEAYLVVSSLRAGRGIK